MVDLHHGVYLNLLHIALYVSFLNIKYNITEGRTLNVTVVSSRTFTTNFIISVNPLLLTATGI